MKAGSRTRTPAPRSVATPTSEVNTEGNWRWTFTGKQPTAMTPMRNLRPPTATPTDSGMSVQRYAAMTSRSAPGRRAGRRGSVDVRDGWGRPVSYTHLRAHETRHDL